MASSKLQFYRKGPDNQKTPDVTFFVKRPDNKQIKKWSTMEKLNIIDFVNDMDDTYRAFKRQLLEASRQK